MKILSRLREHFQISREKSKQNAKMRELLSSLKLHEEREKSLEDERKSMMRKVIQLEERVGALEALFEFQKHKWEKKRKKTKLDMKKRNTFQLQITRELQDALNHCEEEKKVAEHERDHLIRDRERLQERVAQLEAAFDIEKNKWEEENKKVKSDMKERCVLQLQLTRELQDTLIHCEEEKKTLENERDHLMRERERLGERVVQLEITLISEQEKPEQEKD